MECGSTIAIAAPAAHVRYALATADEYPQWNSMVQGGETAMWWSMPRTNGTAVRLQMDLAVADNETVITLRRSFLWRITYRITTASAGPNHTDVHIEVATGGLTGFAVRRLALFASVTCLSTDLATRARWLPQAPDTAYLSDVHHLGANEDAWAAAVAEIRQLASYADGDLLIFDSGSVRSIIDTERRRFLRVDAGAEVDRLVSFALWQPFTDVVRDGGDVVIVPTATAARVRIRPGTPQSPRPDSLMV